MLGQSFFFLYFTLNCWRQVPKKKRLSWKAVLLGQADHTNPAASSKYNKRLGVYLTLVP